MPYKRDDTLKISKSKPPNGGENSSLVWPVRGSPGWDGSDGTLASTGGGASVLLDQ